MNEMVYEIGHTIPMSIAVQIIEELATLDEHKLLRPDENACHYVLVNLVAVLIQEMQEHGHWPPICRMCAGILLDGETCQRCGMDGAL